MLYKESFIVEDIVGKKILIHGYKHNGKIHRCWSKGLVLQETDDHYIVINNRTLVTESEECGIRVNRQFGTCLNINGIMLFV